MDWTHLDLLHIREKKENVVKKICTSKDGLNFIWENLNISKKILEISKPKIIGVVSALSRTFLGKDKINNNGV